jgi:hypothetical protein
MNNYAAALQAIIADSELQASLSSASTDDERSSLLTGAGITLPTQDDYDNYMGDPDQWIQGAADIEPEVFIIPP